ncbi:testis-expressed protein 15 isoform X3 [Mesocricetus auratus]|uniref:Testis-expressed protein 15 isoform X3 n=1 Tax=Mesocricetus auratus TaxID=10036 RepID=A0ABM2WIA0_MESAU|nr:testis-expressed protein 15 isoform X3 [Mesocricetus auratus]
METKENDKYKTWRTSPDSESSWTTGAEPSSRKKFTIPKIRKTTEKVYLSSCYTNTREYGFIHGTLKQSRLDVSCDLQFTWQFGDTKLVRNEYLEKQFSAKRSEMRENGRHGRELEEHFCFLALPQSDVVEIYQNGLSTRASTLKILGNPLLGIYMFRHVDVALNYAHSWGTTVETIMIFKVLFGKVKKVQPSVDKSKVSLDPSPNFDCHMSRNMPSLKDTIELQAYNSMVYFYEYDFFSRPVDRPRQCLPYAIVTVKFIGQKAGNGQLMTSLRFPSTGFPKRLEKTCSLNNCTVAKRIGKGKDATVIFEHFRKPVDSFSQENCPCKALTSEIGSSSLDSSSSYGSVQNGNNSVCEVYSRQTDNSSEVRDATEVHTHNSGLYFMPTANTASGNGDLFSVTYLRSILSSISAALPSQSSTGSSTVITSKLIKDPRLLKREQSMRKQNNADVLPFDKSAGHGNSEIKLTCMPASSVSSPETTPTGHALTNCSDVSCFKFSSERSHCETHNMGSRDYDCTASSKIAITEQFKEQSWFSFPCYLPNAFSNVGKQKYNEEEAQKSSNIPLLPEQSNEPQNSFESEKNTCSKDYQSHISTASWSSDLNTAYKVDHKMSAVSPIQKKGNLDEYVKNTAMMRTFISPEDSSEHVNQTWYKETVHYCTDETICSPIDNCITLHQEHKECGNLNSLKGNCEKTPVTHKLQMPKPSISTTEDKSELDRAAVELVCSLTPHIGCLVQKHPQYPLEHNDNIQTNFVMTQGLTELKAVQNNQRFINVTDAFQEAKDVPQAREQLIGRVISSSATDVSLDSSGCDMIGEYMCIQSENKNETVSMYNLQKDCKETSHIKDDVHDHCLSYVNLKINLQEERDNENPNEAKEKDSTSSPEYSTDNTNESEKQDFHANTVEMREIKSNTKVQILNSEECSTFDSIWGKKGRPAKSTSSESEGSMASLKQSHTPNDGRSVEPFVSTFPETECSSVCVASSATKQVVNTTLLTLNTNFEDHEKYQLKETCDSEISDLCLVKHGVSDCEIDTDKDRLQNFYQLVNENSVLQTFGLGSEIEVELEDYNDTSLFPQNIDSQGHVFCEEFELYESLKSRIAWEGLFGNSNEEMQTSNFAQRESTDPHSTECNCVSFLSQKDKRELHNPMFLPDLQVTITNLISLRIGPTNDSLESKDNFYKRVTESTEPEANEEKAFGFSIYSQPSEENSGFSCENKHNSVQESGHVSKSGISHSSNMCVNHIPGKSNNNSLSTEPSKVTVINEKSNCPTKSKFDLNDTENKKDMESRSSKRSPHVSSRRQNISHKDIRQHETHEKRRKPTSHDSSEHFSSLSQGRIKTFSQSERHIRSVLNILNNEASLCKSKHLSRKLDKAVLHLKKAHRRVHTSLQLISKVGKKRKGPLPRAYSVVCNNFWESCDLQGDSWMSERRSSRHFSSKRRRNTLQLSRKEKMDTATTEPEDNSSQPDISVQTPSAAGCTISSSKKRPVTADKCEVSDAVSNCKKQKVTMKDVRNRQKTMSKNPRTTKSHPKDENRIGSNSSDNLTRDSASPEMVKGQNSTPGSLSPSENIEGAFTPNSESKIELTDSSSDASEYLPEQQESLNGIMKGNVNLNAAQSDKKEHPLVPCNQKDIAATCSPDNSPLQKLHETPADHTQICPSNMKPRNDDPLVPNASVPASCSVRAIHSNLETNDTDFEHEDNEILDLSIKDCTCTSSPEPVCIQDKIPVVQVNKIQPIKDALNPSTSPFGSYGSSALEVNQRAQHTVSKQNGKNPNVLTQKVDTSWNAPPQSTYTAVYNSSEHSFGTSYPYYAWCFYQYSSSSTAVAHTYQGMTTYETPPPMMTAVASAVQNTHFNHSYSEQFSYFARQPQANAFIPGNGFSPSPLPVSYSYQQPAYSQFAPHQLVPQAAYPYPPNPGVLPQAPWTYGYIF